MYSDLILPSSVLSIFLPVLCLFLSFLDFLGPSSFYNPIVFSLCSLLFLANISKVWLEENLQKISIWVPFQKCRFLLDSQTQKTNL